jgi:hypothetical protein
VSPFSGRTPANRRPIKRGPSLPLVGGARHLFQAIHVLNAPSPAATASIRIGEEIAAMAVEALGRD